MKPIRLSKHVQERLAIRGTSEEEIYEAIIKGSREPTKKGRILCRLNFEFNQQWGDSTYPIKQVAPVIVEEEKEIIVVTVYTFYF